MSLQQQAIAIAIAVEDLEELGNVYELGPRVWCEGQVVWRKATEKAGRQCVLQIVPLDGPPCESLQASFAGRVRVLSRLPPAFCSRVLAAHEVHRGPHAPCFAIVSEAPPPGYVVQDLASWIARRSEYTERDARAVFAQLAAAVAAMHRAKIVHRMLRMSAVTIVTPEPDLLSSLREHDESVRVSGFEDLCDAEDYASMSRSSGVSGFVAPEEMLLAEGALKRVTMQTDVWALGVILYAMLSGSLPFGQDPVLYKKEATCGRLSFQEEAWKVVSLEAKDLLRSMLTVDPWRRIKSSDIVNHPWFRGQRPKERPVALTDTRNMFRLALSKKLARAAVSALRFVFRLRKAYFRRADPASLALPGADEQPGTSSKHRGKPKKEKRASEGSRAESEGGGRSGSPTPGTATPTTSMLAEITKSTPVLTPVAAFPPNQKKPVKRGHRISDPEIGEAGRKALSKFRSSRSKMSAPAASGGETKGTGRKRRASIDWKDLTGDDADDEEEKKVYIERATKLSPPEPPMPPPLPIGATREEYKQFMLARYAREEWENSVLLLSVRLFREARERNSMKTPPARSSPETK